MQYFSLCAFIAFHLFCMETNAETQKNYFDSRIDADDKRAATLQLCLQLLEERNAKILVETGTARNGEKNCAGDGCSTVIFADWAKDHEATLFSVDICPCAIAEAKAAVGPLNSTVHFVTSDSIAFLTHFDHPIDFLYLDSYDFDVHRPLPSQKHHLKEVYAAYPFLHEKSVILIDDCGLPHGGKGKMAIDLLLSRGWKILLSGYQTILVRD